MKNKYFLLFIIVSIIILTLTSCSENKKSESKENKELSVTTSDLPNPCKALSIEDIQSTLSKEIVPSNNGKALINPLSKACSWIPEGDDPYSINVTIEVENIGANNIDSSLSSALDENSIYKTTFKEYEIVSAPKIQSTLLTTDKIIYSVRVSGNEKDFSEDADIPTELKVLSDSIRNSGSNTIASYIIAMQIAKNVK